jgi:hypothetical protein
VQSKIAKILLSRNALQQLSKIHKRSLFELPFEQSNEYLNPYRQIIGPLANQFGCKKTAWISYAIRQ